MSSLKTAWGKSKSEGLNESEFTLLEQWGVSTEEQARGCY